MIFHITNLTFIAGIQNVLLLLLGLPTRTAAFQAHTELGPSDYGLAALALAILALEFTADNQQWAYHSYKHAYLATKKGKGLKVEPYNANNQWLGARLNWKPQDAERGFVTRGLWRYSRHPNCLCEQAFWVCSHILPNVQTISDVEVRSG